MLLELKFEFSCAGLEDLGLVPPSSSSLNSRRGVATVKSANKKIVELIVDVRGDRFDVIKEAAKAAKAAANRRVGGGALHHERERNDGEVFDADFKPKS